MRAFRNSAEYDVVGIVEPDEELRRQAENDATYGDIQWMTRDDLLSLPGLQAVAVETRVANLLEHAEACIDAGMHIHLDKPAGASLPHFRAILDAAARKHLLVQMGYMYRYNPAIVFLREALERGWLGRPFEIQAVMSKVVRSADRQRLAAFSGGMMFELACHLIDTIVTIMGPPERIVPYIQHAGDQEDELADNTLAVFTYPQALVCVKSAALEVEGFARRHLTLCGTEGTAHVQPLDEPDVQLALDRDREPYRRGYQTVPFGDYDRYVADVADMARIIRGEKDTDYSYEHDYIVQRTVLEACGMPLD